MPSTSERRNRRNSGVDDFSLFVRQSGDDSAEKVMWLHGYTLDSTIWSEVWSRLPGWQHFALDLPGHGDSRPFRESDDLALIAEEISAITVRLGVTRLVGLSFGSMLALQVATVMAHRLSTLVLCAPSFGGGPLDRFAEARNLELRRMYTERGAGQWLREKWMQSPPEIFTGLRAYPERWDRVAQIVDRHRWQELGLSRFHRVAAYPQPRDTLRRISAQTLIISGENDMPAFKRCAQLIKREISLCHVTYLAGIGHLAPIEAPEKVCPIIERQLQLGRTMARDALC